MTSAILMMALVLPAQAAPETQRFALLVSSNDGGPGRIELRYANDDAAALADVLAQMGGVPAENEFILQDADRSTIDDAIDQLADRIEDAAEEGFRTELVFYYSGHSDETGLLPQGELFEYPDLADDLAEIPADLRVVILDSCASGAMVRMKGGTMKSTSR